MQLTLASSPSVDATVMTLVRLLGRRITATFQRKDGRTLHVRKATRAEPRQQEIYRSLALDPAPAPGGVRKMIV